MTIGTPDSARICRHTSFPSEPGSIRSSSTKSGRESRKASTALSPSATKVGSNPSPRSTIPSISARAASSSTTSTRPLMGPIVPCDRNCVDAGYPHFPATRHPFRDSFSDARVNQTNLPGARAIGEGTNVSVMAGTSGWQYRDWRGAFYPPGVPQRRWLEHYAEQFATVENNGTFYRLPARETFEAWRERVTSDFIMTVKASRSLTQLTRLRDPAQPVQR